MSFGSMPTKGGCLEQRRTRATGGGVLRIADVGVPEVRRIDPGEDGAGQRWIGLLENGDYRVVGVRELSLLPALLVLATALAGIMAAWYRESR